LELGILDSKVELTRYSDIRYIIGKNWTYNLTSTRRYCWNLKKATT
jgi:hypothetical protein